MQCHVGLCGSNLVDNSSSWVLRKGRGKKVGWGRVGWGGGGVGGS